MDLPIIRKAHLLAYRPEKNTRSTRLFYHQEHIRKLRVNQENFNLDSDHTPVILTMSENVIKKEPHLTLVNIKTDWVKFQEDISNNIQ
jgi:hypothetical protein